MLIFLGLDLATASLACSLLVFAAGVALLVLAACDHERREREVEPSRIGVDTADTVTIPRLRGRHRAHRPPRIPVRHVHHPRSPQPPQQRPVVPWWRERAGWYPTYPAGKGGCHDDLRIGRDQ